MQEQDLLVCSGSAPNSVPPARKSQMLARDSLYDGSGECRCGETRWSHTDLAACMGATTDLKVRSTPLRSRSIRLCAQLSTSVHTLLVTVESVWLDGLVPFCQVQSIISYPCPPPQLSLSLLLHIKTHSLPAIFVLRFLVPTPCFTRLSSDLIDLVFHHQLEQHPVLPFCL